jgi:pyruvate dehydrogenase (quinone)
MATNTVGDFVVERMHQWGVRRIYGYPGDGINAAPRWQRPLLEPKGDLKRRPHRQHPRLADK